MGTHRYLMEVFKRENNEVLPTINSLGFHRYSNISTGDFEELVETSYYRNDNKTTENRYMEEFTCREVILNESVNWNEIFDNEDRKFQMGIRCYGEMYTIISRILRRNPKSKELFKNLIANIMGMDVDIRYGILPEEVASRVLGRTRIDYLGGSKEVRGYVTLYINSWNNQLISAIDCGISAILAILKEPRIIRGIVDGTIKDKKSLCKELLKISWYRLRGEDNTYECFSLSGASYSISNLAYIKDRIKSALKVRYNDDGSDWLSMAILSVFLFKFGDFSDGVYTENSGPVSYMMDSASSSTFREFKEFVDENYILKNLRLEIYEEQEDNDEHDFWDEDESESEVFYERTGSWASE